MNYFKTTAYGLVIFSQLTYTGFTLAETPPPSDRRGTITIMDKDKHQCSLPLPKAGETFTYDFQHENSPCVENTAREIEFNEIPSATEILLTDSPTCDINNVDEHFWFKFKTMREPTTTNYIEIEYFKSFLPKAIIRPGLQLIDRWLRSGSTPIRDKLSCVQIKTSAAPPSSVTTPSTVPAQP